MSNFYSKFNPSPNSNNKKIHDYFQFLFVLKNYIIVFQKIISHKTLFSKKTFFKIYKNTAGQFYFFLHSNCRSLVVVHGFLWSMAFIPFSMLKSMLILAIVLLRCFTVWFVYTIDCIPAFVLPFARLALFTFFPRIAICLLAHTIPFLCKKYFQPKSFKKSSNNFFKSIKEKY